MDGASASARTGAATRTTAGDAACAAPAAAGRGPGRRRRGTRAASLAVVSTLVAALALAGCQAGLPDLEPGRTPSATADGPATTAPASPSPTETTPEPTETPTAEPPATETPEPEPSTPPPAPEPTPEPPPAPVEPEELARGATGERVVALQQRLADLGYFIGAPDGDFGGGTQQAVWALQKAAGLSRDGVVGPATQAALDQGVTPQPRSGSGKVIEIDLDRQLLLAVEDGRVVTVVNASSGNGESYEAKGRTYRAGTPRGEFHVGRQVDGNHSSSLELGDMWRPKFFTGGIAVHGSGSIPPWPASHGCVRVANSAMNWLWDTWHADPGTTVLVY
ncbi:MULTISPECIES: L,D-transpeptidase family protein [Cellulosimicrobium]|uniref:L,D-transpeptidase family protein n=1 Tax=Cellulosimicrobium sp. ES-005 TaxID=3163031 RepID=A0AAU8G024_9MICO|nr:L,D-transpeptidase family protein [Cellulosimicrobium cellulans]MCO7275269.1 L,D-transpeptidase family protein [Cellulosimicrobium cellulans]